MLFSSRLVVSQTQTQTQHRTWSSLVRRRARFEGALSTTTTTIASSSSRLATTTTTMATSPFRHPPIHQMTYPLSIWRLVPATAQRTLSTATNTSTMDDSKEPDLEQQKADLVQQKRTWRQLVKPFLLQCHPDVISSETQLETGPTLKEINLKAIQNLNSYLDTVSGMVDSIVTHQVVRMPAHSTLMVEFILLIHDTSGRKVKKAHLPRVMSRRKVELVLPSQALLQDGRTPILRLSNLTRHVLNELSKLLKVAGLEVSHHVKSEMLRTQAIQQWHENQQRQQQQQQNKEQPTKASSEPAPDINDFSRYSRARYRANRLAFTQTLDWNKIEKLHRQAELDAQVDIARQKLLERDPDQKLRIVAQVLSQIQVQRFGQEGNDYQAIPLQQELVAFRRLTLLLQENFEDLDLQYYHYNSWWDRLSILLTPERPYNTSPSAMHKRALRALDNGFSYTLHSTTQVSMTIPIDFRDEELLSELKRNMEDFSELMGDGMEDIFKEGTITKEYYNESELGF